MAVSRFHMMATLLSNVDSHEGDKDAEEVRTSDQFMMVKSGAGGDQVRTLLPQITLKKKSQM